MDKRSWVFGLGVTAVMVGWPMAAAADNEPLLIVVEAAPDADADPVEIRRAITAEVHLSAVAPTAAASEGAERALIVGVERNRIAVALRDRYALPVVRVIPAPAEHGARVRAISWLAGNLVRDQVSGIVTSTTASGAELANMPALSAKSGADPGVVDEEPSTVHSTTEPPPYQVPAVAVTSGSPPAPESPPRWVLSLETGPVMGIYDSFRRISGPNLTLIATLWRLEVRRFSLERRFFLAVSLEGTTGNYNPEAVGAAGLCGWRRRHGPWAIEGTLGLGLDVGRRSAPSETTMTTQTAAGIVSETTVTPTLGAGIYGTAGFAVSHAVGDAANLFLRLGAHVSTVEGSDWFLSSTLGLSYGLW